MYSDSSITSVSFIVVLSRLFFSRCLQIVSGSIGEFVSWRVLIELKIILCDFLKKKSSLHLLSAIDRQFLSTRHDPRTVSSYSRHCGGIRSVFCMVVIT
jgi:hypothetical protein